MNGNVPLLLHASVPPLRQAPCHGYSINHSIKQSNIHCFTFLPVPNFLPLHPHAHKRTRTQFLKRKTKRSIRAHCVSSPYEERERKKSDAGSRNGNGNIFSYSSSCCNIGHNFIHATALKHRTLHACTWKSNSSPGERERDHWGLCQSFCRFRAERDKKERLRGTFVSVFVEGWAWVSMSASPAPNTTWDSLVRHSAADGDLRGGDGPCASGGWEMCCPVSNMRLLSWRRDGQDSAGRFPAEYSHGKNIEKKPNELSFLTHAQNHTAINCRAMAWCGESINRDCTHHICRLTRKQ